MREEDNRCNKARTLEKPMLPSVGFLVEVAGEACIAIMDSWGGCCRYFMFVMNVRCRTFDVCDDTVSKGKSRAAYNARLFSAILPFDDRYGKQIRVAKPSVNRRTAVNFV